MKHNERLVNTKGKPLLEQVYTILDSRIQYIEYQAQKQFCFPATGIASPSCDKVESLLHNFDQMLDYLQELNASLKLLQILKSWLKEENVTLIFQLLHNKRYLSYSEEALENYLRKEAPCLQPILDLNR